MEREVKEMKLKGQKYAAAGLKPVMVLDLAEPTVEMEALAEVILPSFLEVSEYLSL